MANPDHLAILKRSMNDWHAWRSSRPADQADLSGADLVDVAASAPWFPPYFSHADFAGTLLRGANLSGLDMLSASFYKADLSGARLDGALLNGANFREANLTGAHLTGTHLIDASFRRANLANANLTSAVLRGADLGLANLNHAHLQRADLSLASFIMTRLGGADLRGCRVYGLAAWDVVVDEGTKQTDLVITRDDQARIALDGLEIAQFAYLLLKNEKLRAAIDVISRKAILILGRFTPEPRKRILDALRDALRARGYLAIVCDFERPMERDFTETIKIMAGLSLFVIVDVTNPRSTPLELQATVPDYMIPFVTILQKGEEPFSMLANLTKYQWVVKPVVVYESAQQLIRGIDVAVLNPALERRNQLLKQRIADIPMQDIGDLLISQPRGKN
jgi:hypothetical protein